MTDYGCSCPELKDQDWEGQTHDFSEKTFYVEDVRYFFDTPVGLDKKVMQAAEDIDRKGYVVEEPLMVLAESGRFKGRIWIAILPPDGADPHVRSLPVGKLFSTVYSRKTASVGPGVKAFRSRLKGRNITPKTIYLWHITCPRCCPTKGYRTVIFAGT